MESKICTYTEKGNRLQLVRVVNSDINDQVYEIRLNRCVIERVSYGSPRYARLLFVHAVNEIVVNRSTTMLKIT